MTDVQVQGFMLAKRAPVVGDVDTFTYGEETSRAGKPYTRIRRNSPEYDGTPFKVLAVEPTQNPPDQHGNQGYSVTLAATGEATTPVVRTTAVGQPQQNTREENIAQAGAYNAAVELVAQGKVPIESPFDIAATIEKWHEILLPFRRSIVGLAPVEPDPTPPLESTAAAAGLAPQTEQQETIDPEGQDRPPTLSPDTGTDDDIPF